MAKRSRTWIVSSSGERPLDEIAADLKKRGFKVKAVLGEVGSITGSGGDDVVAEARKVKGVADVSPDIPINVGPPSSPDTW